MTKKSYQERKQEQKVRAPDATVPSSARAKGRIRPRETKDKIPTF
jgi:hypothetical protein